MSDKIIVLTTYGQGESIDNFCISLFDRSEPYQWRYSSDASGNAVNYCKNINELELKDDCWVHAEIIHENQKIVLKKPPQMSILAKLDDFALQKVLRTVDKTDLIRVMKNIDEKTKERIFRNISPRAVEMMKDDIEAMPEISLSEIKSSRKNIMDVIQRLQDTAKIILADSG